MVDQKSTQDPFDKEIQEVLMENTASSIFNYLRDMENMGNIYAKRWVWELTQNALDSAKIGQPLKINMILEKNILRFQHNGRPFEKREVAHLICHGSTKGKNDIGQFGTGFLTTHLLSKKVRVKTKILSGEETDFIINRDAHTPEEMKSLMFEALNSYRGSCKTPTLNDGFTTNYEYEISESTYLIAKKGVEDLIRIAPYVLAFNPTITTITIINDSEKIEFVILDNSKSDKCDRIIVEQTHNNTLKTQHELWVKRDRENDVEIALKAKQSGNKCVVEDLSSIPKIFLAFPLYYTDDLPLPIIINSKSFVPVDKRDGIFLNDADTMDNEHNKKRIKEGLSLFIELLSSLSLDTWCDLHNLLVFSQPPKKEWLDDNWIRKVLEGLIDELINVKLVKTSDGSYLTPSECQIPCFDEKINEHNIEKLWLLASEFSDLSDKLPDKSLLIDWAKIMKGWEELNENVSHVKLSLDKLTERIVNSSNIAALEKNLNTDSGVYDFLNKLYKFIEELQRLDLFDKELFPNQDNYFNRKSGLFKDDGIDEDLKDISKMLNKDVRSELLHARITPIMQLPKKTEEEIIPQLTSKIREVLTYNEDYLKANVKLFNWLLKNGKILEFNGYPVLSCEEHNFKNLSRDFKLLPPVSVWKSTLKTYSDIFPQEFILSSKYNIQEEDSHELKGVIDAGYFYCSPIISIKETIKSDELQNYLFDSTGFNQDESHELNTEVNDIAYLSLKDKGIVDTMRNSKQKAKKFLKFLLEYISLEDKKWNTFIEVQCNCGGKHKLRPCMWIHTLKKRQWIPTPKDMPLTSLNLAKLIEEDVEILGLLEKELPINLLQILGIGAFELKLNALTSDIDKRLEFDRAASSFLGAVKNLENFKQIAQVMADNPEEFIEEIKKTMQEKQKIRNNQETGTLVEQLLKGLLEKEGFTVKRTGVGSDYLIEYDFIENGSEVLLEVRKEKRVIFYIEIKFTKQSMIKMSYEQAKEASDKKANYVLCALKLDTDEVTEDVVKESIKFVVDIGEQLKPCFDEASEYQLKVRTDAQLVPMSKNVDVEISQGSIYFQVNESAWNEAKNYSEFIEFVKASK